MKERELFLLMYYRSHHRIISLEVSCIVLENNKFIEITLDRFISEKAFCLSKFLFFRRNNTSISETVLLQNHYFIMPNTFLCLIRFNIYSIIN